MATTDKRVAITNIHPVDSPLQKVPLGEWWKDELTPVPRDVTVVLVNKQTGKVVLVVP